MKRADGRLTLLCALLVLHALPLAAESAEQRATDRQWLESIREDRWRVGVSMERGVILPTVLIERSLDTSHRVGLRINVAGIVTALHANSIAPDVRFQQPYMPIAGIGYRLFLFSDSSELVLRGISLGADAEAGFRLYQQEMIRQEMWGASAGPMVGVSLKLFTWLWIEATAGSYVRVSRMTEYGVNAADPICAIEISPSRSVTVGVSF